MLHLSRLLEHGADINQPDDTGTTLLLRLLPTGNLPLLQFLLQSGAKCEPQWLESMEDPTLLSQLRRTLDDIKIRNMMLGR
jgi:ankyrin repeat protein